MIRIPIVYNLRSLKGRPVSTAFTAVGVGLVVAVFVAMLALANGFAVALTSTGSPDNVLILRKGADSELSSGISRADASVILSSPHVARDASGVPLASPEVFTVIPLGRAADTTQMANVVVRGVSERIWQVRVNLAVSAGRVPEPGRHEVCVGEKLVGRFPNTGLGEGLRIAGATWEVVCHFTAAGSSFESEVWGLNEQIMPVMRGSVYQSITFRLADPGAFAEAKRALEEDRRVTVDAYREIEFYAQQSEVLGTVLRILAIVITSIMAVGAVFGAVNTMHAAVASRRSEIAVLLTLGFHPRSVLVSFLAESTLIALVGGAIGCLLALPINGIVANTTNWASFSEIAFAFRVTPGLLVLGLAFAAAMGILGGFFPARRASKLQVVEAIRR
ncbi:MAG: ABC transporter permease [Gemmatimonadaceae bacterium]|nr:ABC transporter permease [Gemmatimonadaceae bacterium]MCW5827304.1 ABC transporter permease [Gemmatimonadaceae bacterium]